MEQRTDGVAATIVLVIALFVLAKLAPPRYLATAPRVEAAIDLLAEVRRRVLLSAGESGEVRHDAR
jgi:hypothetical protein